jgi:LPS-assembly lipoprotein
MSLPDPTRRRLLALGAFGIALPLGGCFRPLYGESKIGGGSVQDALSEIVIEPLSDRIGHYLVQELGFELNGSGVDKKPRYVLAVGLSERVQSTIVNSVTGNATAAAVIVTANFTLKEIVSDKKILSGSAYASASYDRFQQRFANLRAARDAEIRIARNLADQLRTRIAAHFATGV